VISEHAWGAWCGAAQVDTLLKQLTEARNDSEQHIMADTSKREAASPAVTSVRKRQHMHILTRHGGRGGREGVQWR
jgi:hypothetical protein